jgi:hypothetical protein
VDQFVGIFGIDYIVDQVQVNVFTPNDWRAFFVLESIEGS